MLFILTTTEQLQSKVNILSFPFLLTSSFPPYLLIFLSVPQISLPSHDLSKDGFKMNVSPGLKLSYQNSTNGEPISFRAFIYPVEKKALPLCIDLWLTKHLTHFFPGNPHMIHVRCQLLLSLLLNHLRWLVNDRKSIFAKAKTRSHLWLYIWWDSTESQFISTLLILHSIRSMLSERAHSFARLFILSFCPYLLRTYYILGNGQNKESESLLASLSSSDIADLNLKLK